MNIAIFTDSFLPKIDGVCISVENFSRILASRGHRFVICAPKYNKTESDDFGANIEIFRFKNAPLPSYPDVRVVLPAYGKIKKAMTDFKPDLVHIQTPGLLGQYGALASKMYRVPLMGTYHTLISEQATYISLYRLLKMDTLMNYFKSQRRVDKHLDKLERKKQKTLKQKLIMKLCNSLYETGKLIVTPSHMIKKELENHDVTTPIEVVSNGMDLAVFKGQPKTAPEKAPRFLHVGRISYEKNCDVVLRAFAIVLKSYPEATLTIIGDGPALTSMKIEAGRLGIKEQVEFTGFKERHDLPKIYPEYDLFITASTMETQGLVVLEAMACGLPCVGVDAYALPELIQNERNGLVVEPFDHKAMAESIIRILSNATLYRAFSTESLSIASGHDLQACADRLEKVYQRVAAMK